MAIKAEEKTNIKDFMSGRSDLYRVSPDQITIRDGWNGRDMEDEANKAHVAALKQSIKEVGLLEPLVCYVEGGELRLNSGHCRLTAIRELMADGIEIKAVAVRVEERGTDEATRVHQQITRNSGKSFSTLETAAIYRRLLGFGWTEQEIADRSGRAVSSVRSDLDFLAAPKEITDLVKDGKVSASMAKSEIRKAKGDTSKASANLAQAVETAQKTGRKKAFLRDLAENAPERKNAVADALRAAVRGEDGSVTLTMDAETYAHLCLMARVPVTGEVV